jgi:hypothetical protein
VLQGNIRWTDLELFGCSCSHFHSQFVGKMHSRQHGAEIG